MAIGVACICAPAMAQYEGTTLDDRIGSGEDSIETRRNLSMFNMAIKQNSFTEAYDVWKPVIEKAPFANLRIYTDGSYMLQTLITQEQDAAKKKVYLDELMALYDLRLKNLKGLNSFARADLQATEGDVVYPQAYCYAVYGPQADPQGYTHDKAYQLFEKANKLLEEQGGREVKGYMLDIFSVSVMQNTRRTPTASASNSCRTILRARRFVRRCFRWLRMSPTPRKLRRLSRTTTCH